jgi:hypothetical protein
VGYDDEKITLISDSVLKGAVLSALTLLGPKATVDATVRRQFKHVGDTAPDLRGERELGEMVVIRLDATGRVRLR